MSKEIVRLGVKCLSVDSGTHQYNGVDTPAVSVNVNHLNRTVSVGMTANDARALAALILEQADRAEQVTLNGAGQSAKN